MDKRIVNIWLPAPLRNGLKGTAERDGVPLNIFIERLLAEGLARHEAARRERGEAATMQSCDAR